jgi:acetyl esterase/lipase
MSPHPIRRIVFRAAALLCAISIAALLIAVAPTRSAPSTRPALASIANPAAAQSIQFDPDVTYGHAGGQDLKLDLARPTDSARALPCIVFVHGGGWAMGSKNVYDSAIRAAAAQGFVAATIEYRLAPDFRFPAQVEDVKCAVRFLRASTKRFDIDPDRIGAIGDSAGGYLVMMLAVTRPEDGFEGDGGSPGVSSSVQAVVSLYGPTDFNAGDIPELSKPIVQGFMGEQASSRDARAKASPISYVHAGEPPMLLLQGTNDPLVPSTQASLMSAAMAKAAAPGRIELLINASHGFIGADRKHALDAATAFFEQYLRPR